MRKSNLPYINREVAWLSFNERVLQEAADPTTPLLERVKFLAIYSNNRDEFYRVRVATVKRMIPLGRRAIPLIGANPNDVLDTILKSVIEQQKRFEEIYQDLLKELQRKKIFIINERELDEKQQVYAYGKLHSDLSFSIYPIPTCVCISGWSKFRSIFFRR